MNPAGINVDLILQTLNQNYVEYLLIGGMNFLLRHKPVLTYDVDVWINDTEDNCRRCELALIELGAQWGATDADWKPVSSMVPGWLRGQELYSLTTSYGALDVFRYVRGLEDWLACRNRSYLGKTKVGTPFQGLSDQDMLTAQYALDKRDQKQERIEHLKNFDFEE